MPAVVRNHQATTNTIEGSRHVATVDTRYIKLDSEPDDFLKVAFENGNATFLCEYTKVTLIKRERGRIYFKISDGWNSHVGQTAYLSEKNEHFLSKSGPTLNSEVVHVQYATRSQEISPFKGKLDQQWATLNINNQHIQVTLNSVWSTRYTPIPPGRHRIMSPDNSHAQISTRGYREFHPGKIKANNVWFPIELAGTAGNSSRYVHIGHLSEGCVTVHDLLHWNNVYDFLISHRIPNTNGKYVAFLEVKK